MELYEWLEIGIFLTSLLLTCLVVYGAVSTWKASRMTDTDWQRKKLQVKKGMSGLGGILLALSVAYGFDDDGGFDGDGGVFSAVFYGLLVALPFTWLYLTASLIARRQDAIRGNEVKAMIPTKIGVAVLTLIICLGSASVFYI